MRKSLRNRLSLILGLTYLVSAVGVLSFGVVTTRAIITAEKERAFAEQLDVIVRMLERRDEKLTSSGMQGLYAKGYRQSTAQDLGRLYYRGEPGIYPFIVDSTGRIVLHPQLPASSEEIAGLDFTDGMIAAGNGRMDYSWRGEEKWMVFRTFKPWGWTIGYTITREQKYAMVTQVVTSMTAIIALSSLLGLGVMYLVLGRVVRPIQRLVHDAGVIGSGQYDHQVSASGGLDETAELAASFARMTENVRERDGRLRESQERYRLLAEQLEAKNTELERFAYTVSHDLRSPLVTVKGFLGLLEEDLKKGDRAAVDRDIARIDRATGKMEELLHEILELSRIGRLVSELEDVAMSEVANEALYMTGGVIDEMGAGVRVDPGMPVVRGERARLVEVWQNLIDNAAKYMGEQVEPRIEIGVRRDAEGGADVFYVRDNGIGVDPQYHEKIFGLFNQLDRSAEGTGVGLAIVKRIVDFHGGRVWVESEGEGKGSAFCFTVPGVPRASGGGVAAGDE